MQLDAHKATLLAWPNTIDLGIYSSHIPLYQETDYTHRYWPDPLVSVFLSLPHCFPIPNPIQLSFHPTQLPPFPNPLLDRSPSYFAHTIGQPPINPKKHQKLRVHVKNHTKYVKNHTKPGTKSSLNCAYFGIMIRVHLLKCVITRSMLYVVLKA